MKTILIAFLFTAFSLTVYSQTAVNFTCNDCNGNPHDLYTELDSGNVIVLCFVMPCWGCIDPTYAAYTEVQALEPTYPDRIHMYIVDDEGTLPCPLLVDWCLNNNMLKTTRFSDTLIRMSDYGKFGMPKIVVMGGGSAHHVYYIADDSLNVDSLHNAIINALTPFENIASVSRDQIKSKIIPNPSSDHSDLFLEIEKNGEYKIDLFETNGRFVRSIYKGILEEGEQKIGISTSYLKAGVYFIRIEFGNGAKSILELNVIR